MRRNFFPASEESAGCPAQRLISFSQRSMFRAARGTPTDTVRSGWWWIVSAATPLSRPSDGPSAFLPTLHPGSLFCGCQHNGPNRNNHFNLFFTGKCPATWVIEFSRTLDVGGTQIGTVQVALTLEDVPRPNFGPMESMTFVSCATASRLD